MGKVQEGSESIYSTAERKWHVKYVGIATLPVLGT